MPIRTLTEFKAEVDPLKAIYRQDNKWVGWWRNGSWNHEYVMDAYIRAAYQLYKATSENRLNFVVLGGTSIRMSRELIMNFGVTAANGIQDRKTELAVQQVRADRDAPRPTVDEHGAPMPAPPNPDNTVVPVVGVGSILSEDRWTPILNDALIVGSATAQHEFLIALEPYELGLWRECEATLKPELEKMRQRHAQRNGVILTDHALKNTDEYIRMIWSRFFNWNKGMFWDVTRENPRVLARELLGLSMFGYRVKLADRQIGFYPDVAAPDPRFVNYVNGLRNIRFHERTARARIMRALSSFLLNDSHAICFSADRPALAGLPHVGHQNIRFV